MKRFSIVLMCFVLVGLGVSVHASTDQTAIIKARQAHLKELGGHMKAIGDALAAGKTDAATIQPEADAIAILAHDLPGWFPAGSGPDSGVDTKALPAIWTNPADFAKAAGDFQAEAAKLVAVSSSGDANAIGGELKAVGGTCGGCHKQFRQKL